MKRAIISFTIVLLAVTGCATTGAPISLTTVQRNAVRATVTGMLKDPESARFGSIQGARNNEGVTYVCGLVNARNSFGGNSGMLPFTGYFESGSSSFSFGEMGSNDGYGVAIIHG